MSQIKPTVLPADIIIGPPEKEPDAALAASCPTTFTQFSGPPESRLTKAFSLDNAGNIDKDSTPNFSTGDAKSVNINNLSEIEPIIESLQTNQCIATGVFDEATCKIVTADGYQNMDDKSGFRTRTKDHMQQPSVGLALLDYDSSPFMPEQLRCDSPEALMEKIVAACPELRDAGYASTGSASSGIYNKDTDDAYTGGGGMHIYLAIENVDLEQLRKFLEARLWIAGYGYIAFARNGAMLTRTVVDTSVLSPERIIYEARPVLSEGIGQKERTWTHRPGEILNGIPALTAEEVALHEELVAEAKKHPDNVARAEVLLDSHHIDRVRKLADTKKITVEEAETQLPRRTLADLEKSTQPLDSNDTIEIGGEIMPVSELLERGAEFDGKSMPDPIEGSDYGKTTAKFYYNDGQSPCIHSFAHGQKTIYKIILPESDVNIPDRSKNEVLTNNHVDLTKPLDPEGFPHTRRLANESAKPLCTIENVAHLLNSYGIIAQYDVIGKEIQITIPGQHGVTENSANTTIERINSLATLNGLPTAQVPRYVAVIADENPINRVADWMCSKKWDGIDRIDAICDTLVTQEGFPKAFKKTLVTKWLRSVVAAATTPHGFHTRGVLTLQGPQLIGKSSWIRNLMPPGLLRDRSILTGHNLDPGNKDSLTTAIKHLIVEIGELEGSFNRDIARLKGFLTQDRDSVRRPYARTNAEYQRRTVFCATVNDENFLVDQTGNSRFWTIPVESINYEHGIDTQQLDAQLYVELQQGAKWWLATEEDKQLEELNQTHRAVNAIEERVQLVMNPDLPDDRWVHKKPIEVLMAIGIRSPSNRQCKDCADVLKREYGPARKSQGALRYRIPLDLSRIPYS